MKLIKDFIISFQNFENILDPQNLMNEKVEIAHFTINASGGLNAKAPSGRGIICFLLADLRSRVLLYQDNSDVKNWKANKKKGPKPLKKLALARVG